jgi:hypothetical protein
MDSPTCSVATAIKRVVGTQPLLWAKLPISRFEDVVYRLPASPKRLSDVC